MSSFHKLTVSEIIKETPNSVTISFLIPELLKEVFRFKAGQYITIKHHHNGTEFRRSYSICTNPSSGKLSIGVKRVPRGVFSEFANSVLRPGDTLDVMPPEGRFILDPEPARSIHYLALAAGSGITPILSIIKTVLAEEPKSTISLFYGNRSMEETMYRAALDSLQQEYPERFFPEYIFSRTKESSGLFGRIERATLNYMLKNRFRDSAFSSYYLCGPEEMIKTCSEVLKDHGAQEDQIRFELFTSSQEGSLNELHEGFTELTVTLDDETETFLMPQTSSVLEAVLKHGMDAPFSCQGGICSTCIARKSGGNAEMRKNQILTDDEIAEGLILTCQAHPSSPKLSIDYDDV